VAGGCRNHDASPRVAGFLPWWWLGLWGSLNRRSFAERFNLRGRSSAGGAKSSTFAVERSRGPVERSTAENGGVFAVAACDVSAPIERTTHRHAQLVQPQNARTSSSNFGLPVSPSPERVWCMGSLYRDSIPVCSRFRQNSGGQFRFAKRNPLSPISC